MKTLILLLGMLLFAGCATTDTEPPTAPPVNDLHAQVFQADNDWAWFIGVGTPSESDIARVFAAREAFDEAVEGGDAKRIRQAAETYIGLVNELMIPPLGVSPKRKHPP